MKHIQTLRPAKAGDQIAKRIVPHMAHMDAPRRIGEHLEHVIFRLVGIVVSYETLASFPPVLPFGLDGGGVVLIHYGHHKTRGPSARFRNNYSAMSVSDSARISLARFRMRFSSRRLNSSSLKLVPQLPSVPVRF